MQSESRTENVSDNDRSNEPRTGVQAQLTHPTTPEDAPDLSTDDLFDLLRSERRRELLYLLDDREVVSLSEASEYLAALEADDALEPYEVDSQARKRVYVGLYQCHLPKLDSYGVALWDKSADEITTGENFAAVLEPLEAVERELTDQTDSGDSDGFLDRVTAFVGGGE